MPRVKKSNLNDEMEIFNEIYTDTWKVKKESLSIMNQIGKNVDYDNKNEVITLLPHIQKQMDIIKNCNDTILSIHTKIYGEKLP